MTDDTHPEHSATPAQARRVLVLQGGGALGSYQAGAFQALCGAGFEPEWVAGISQGPSVVKVSVADVRVEHEVKFAQFLKWLDRPPRSPRDVSARHEIRSFLGMPAKSLSGFEQR